ncbi:RicAFT regulatory complex protein RicA family protein [Marinococcus sp. PL1-022]|uniref:RicAFT regulatory complex protein RicA family protein n=1 Tax=Marinococcus sp. PL1-022 TaxID=3095363 RepID=UPI0029C31056|nr:YlbF family regulator [Marinococcus sp. PL1-022]MDX6152530.1 YlbF family regulator [Marinococcus sp. PL1-022]
MAYTKDEVMQEAGRLAERLKETEEVDFFIRAETQINDNVRIQNLIQEIKDKQKQAVNFQHYEKTEAKRQVEAQINDLHEEIENIPIVGQFRQSQTEVNYILQLISDQITASIWETENDDNSSS